MDETIETSEIITEDIRPCNTDCLDCEIFEICNGSLKLI
jgi:hypothetical protein